MTASVLKRPTTLSRFSDVCLYLHTILGLEYGHDYFNLLLIALAASSPDPMPASLSDIIQAAMLTQLTSLLDGLLSAHTTPAQQGCCQSDSRHTFNGIIGHPVRSAHRCRLCCSGGTFAACDLVAYARSVALLFCYLDCHGVPLDTDTAC